MTSRRAATSVANVASTSAASVPPLVEVACRERLLGGLDLVVEALGQVVTEQRLEGVVHLADRRSSWAPRSAATSSRRQVALVAWLLGELVDEEDAVVDEHLQPAVGFGVVGDDLAEGVATVEGLGPVGDDQVGFGRDHLGVGAQVVAPALVAEQLGDVVVGRAPSASPSARGCRHRRCCR